MISEQTIGPQAFAQMLAEGSVLEQDERGAKVILLDSGDILKVFRVRHRWSMAHIFSYAQRFCRNATRLQKLAIPTMCIKSRYRVQGRSESLVRYAPLLGKTLRQLLDAGGSLDGNQLGAFIARLHQNGIHFRSLHLGNIILCEDNTFGLIDIADMRIYPWPLFCNTRARNFMHLCRYEADMQLIGKENWRALLHGYFNYSPMAAICQAKIKRTIADITHF
jgi:hypothetical protein